MVIPIIEIHNLIVKLEDLEMILTYMVAKNTRDNQELIGGYLIALDTIRKALVRMVETKSTYLVKASLN